MFLQWTFRMEFCRTCCGQTGWARGRPRLRLGWRWLASALSGTLVPTGNPRSECLVFWKPVGGFSSLPQAVDRKKAEWTKRIYKYIPKYFDMNYSSDSYRRITGTFCLSLEVMPWRPFCGGSTMSWIGSSGCGWARRESMLLPWRQICFLRANGFKNSI